MCLNHSFLRFCGGAVRLGQLASGIFLRGFRSFQSLVGFRFLCGGFIPEPLRFLQCSLPFGSIRTSGLTQLFTILNSLLFRKLCSIRILDSFLRGSLCSFRFRSSFFRSSLCGFRICGSLLSGRFCSFCGQCSLLCCRLGLFRVIHILLCFFDNLIAWLQVINIIFVIA